MKSLPIDSALPELLQALTKHNRCLLQAAPGAGKTTRVPPSLLQQPWLGGQKILMLEPRRIAARSAAAFMALELGEKAGQTIGYRSRLDTKVSAQTRIEVVTEGILTRMLQSDPALEGVGCVIFDEFHERNLNGDIGLALLLQSQQLLRDELKILLMSATLELEPIRRLLGPDTPVISSEGRSFPVQIEHLGGNPSPFDPTRMAQAIEQALSETEQSLLAFLPGSGEIQRTLRALRQCRLPDNVESIPLYGQLSPNQQDRAINPPEPGQRKLVLATAIAETSLTLEGIDAVVDGGLMRLPRFDPRSGMTRLQTQVVSRASATQRAGRAGRLQAGRCYRLWAEERTLVEQSPAEILHADLAPLVLELAQWGAEADELEWLDAPPPVHLAQARELLIQLGALSDSNQLTTMGEQLLKLGTHPRLGTLMLHAKQLGLGALGCQLAALLSERDPFSNQPGADLRQRLLQLQHSKEPAAQRIRESARRWCRQLKVSDQLDGDGNGNVDAALEQCGLLLAFGFPDRIAQRRSGSTDNNDQPGQHYRLRNGKGAEFRDRDPLCRHRYLVCADLDGDARSARIFLAAPLDAEELKQHFDAQIEQRQQIGWDNQTESVRGHSERWLGKLCLDRQPLAELDEQQLADGLIAGIRQRGVRALPWEPRSRQLQQQLALLRQYLGEDWPDLSDAHLTNSLEHWLAPYLNGMRKLTELKRLNLRELLYNQLDWNQQQQLSQLLPERIQVPSGSHIRIDYSNPEQPLLAVRLQEIFGWQQTPTLLNGKLPLTLQILSPAQRPIQITQDLAGFWSGSYREVCKEMKGRYPKHFWPDDPLQAVATRQTKKRMDQQAKAKN
ncbi:ATP-dependent helicase HrpB [Motiliproteus coralliicola]|uniref:ATP-dependent helicase HrpB n=1 Tax=Motiliproteus coralliicola TaxID=2283196 RepID=A0A369WWY0_9GAMM|nr:ATP-dependent helicase HrpB [Motiliproteus coralliicola]RDE25046.1 ATP-dependent helicase HrpB [Motiliproteus coralliicola]